MSVARIIRITNPAERIRALAVIFSVTALSVGSHWQLQSRGPGPQGHALVNDDGFWVPLAIVQKGKQFIQLRNLDQTRQYRLSQVRRFNWRPGTTVQCKNSYDEYLSGTLRSLVPGRAGTRARVAFQDSGKTQSVALTDCRSLSTGAPYPEVRVRSDTRPLKPGQRAIRLMPAGSAEYCVHIQGYQTRAGTRLHLWSCNGHRNEQFIYDTQSGKLILQAKRSLCIAVRGDYLNLQNCAAAEAWTPGKRGRLRSRTDGGRCIGLQRWQLGRGNRLTIRPCHARGTTQWNLDRRRSPAETQLARFQALAKQPIEITAHGRRLGFRRDSFFQQHKGIMARDSSVTLQIRVRRSMLIGISAPHKAAHTWEGADYVYTQTTWFKRPGLHRILVRARIGRNQEETKRLGKAPYGVVATYYALVRRGVSREVLELQRWKQAPLPSERELRADYAYDYTRIDRHARATPERAMRSVSALTAYLSAGARSDREKVRALIVWFGKFIKYGSDRLTTSHADDALRFRQGICMHQSLLFDALARRMGLRTAYLHGPTKHRHGQGDGYHAWNAVVVDGSWRLVDATWRWFPTHPRHFVQSHFPYAWRYTLLQSPTIRSKAEWRRTDVKELARTVRVPRRVQLNARLLRMGFATAGFSHPFRDVEAPGGRISFRFPSHRDVKLIVNFRDCGRVRASAQDPDLSERSASGAGRAFGAPKQVPRFVLGSLAAIFRYPLHGGLEGSRDPVRIGQLVVRRSKAQHLAIPGNGLLKTLLQ